MHCCPHSTMKAMWTYKVHLRAYARKADYILYLAEELHIWGYVPLTPRQPFHHVCPHCERCSLIRAPHAPSCQSSSSPRACVSTSHHCHIESTLPHLYKKICCSGRTVLQYSTVTKTIGWTMRNRVVTYQWETNDGSHDVTLVLTHDQFKIWWSEPAEVEEQGQTAKWGDASHLTQALLLCYSHRVLHTVESGAFISSD